MWEDGERSKKKIMSKRDDLLEAMDVEEKMDFETQMTKEGEDAKSLCPSGSDEEGGDDGQGGEAQCTQRLRKRRKSHPENVEKQSDVAEDDDNDESGANDGRGGAMMPTTPGTTLRATVAMLLRIRARQLCGSACLRRVDP